MLRLADIEAARARIRDAVLLSPCAHSRVLSARFGGELYLKLENLQMTGSFKERGACNKLVQLTDAERAAGVITASAGNHAQAVALHARRLGLTATIVMPLATPLVKVSATRELGAKVVMHGGNYDEAYAEARRLEQECGATFVHPFDDLDVMAGQGTLGLELVEQVAQLDTVIVPVGGGGLASGVALAIKSRSPHTRIIGVQSAAVPSLPAALALHAPVEVDSRRTIADGIAVRRVGERCLPLCERYVDEVLTVDEETIAEAVLFLLEREKTVAEGAGAAALAGLLTGGIDVAGQNAVVLVSGGNVDVNLIARIIDRGLWRTGRLACLRCTLNDVPGALSVLLGLIAEQQANVLEIEHARFGDGLELGQTSVEILLETRGLGHLEEIEARLQQAGINSERAHADGTTRRSGRVPSPR